jgi:hypothetical protein
MLIICLSLSSEWPGVDSIYCPNIIQCEDPCVIQADPDIAGIGVSNIYSSDIEIAFSASPLSF